MNYPLTSSFTHPPKFLAISSINYGYVPSMMESPKALFVTLKFPPPRDFRIESTVRLQLRPGVGIDTSNSSTNTESNSVFGVEDIVGMNIILKPLSHYWSPDLGNPSQVWGYDMRRNDVRPLRQDWHYGYGAHQSFLEYYPREF